MKASSIALFIKWKRNLTGTFLFDHEGNVMNDVERTQIICEGGRKDPKIVVKFNSAVKTIHNARGIRG